MGKLAVIEIGDGDFQQGFPTTIKIGEDSQHYTAGVPGRLPAKPELPELYKDWQKSYRLVVPHPRLSSGIVTNYSKLEIVEKGKNLKVGLNEWLNSQEFNRIRDSLQRELNRSEEIRVIIQTDIVELQQLPWHLWDIFNHYCNADVGLSSRTHASAPKQRLYYRQDKIRLLATFGCITGHDGNKINTKKDWQFLQEHLGDIADLFPIEEPTTLILNNTLREYQPDIFFYAGHSSTDANSQTGQIDSKRIENLEFAFRKAVEHGLRLAIFNSCEGLGIARNLALLQIPQIIIMREPIPDAVAHKFLENFLQEFVKNKKPLYLALREARGNLQHLEEEFPGATWLPVIFQDLTEISPTWNDLQQAASENSNKSWIKRYFRLILMGALGLTGLIILSATIIIQAIALHNQATIDRVTKNNTVLIKGKNQGSGVVFAQKGKTYYVLTAKSVVNTKDKYKILLVNKKGETQENDAKIRTDINKKLSGIDLVVLQFDSNENYNIARLGNYEIAREGTAFFLSGWSEIDGNKEPLYYFIDGKIASLPEGSADAYTLIYDSNSREGMIGGPLIDINGCVIGIHGREETEAIRNFESAEIGRVKNRSNRGISMKKILQKISDQQLEKDLGRIDKDCK